MNVTSTSEQTYTPTTLDDTLIIAATSGKLGSGEWLGARLSQYKTVQGVPKLAVRASGRATGSVGARARGAKGESREKQKRAAGGDSKEKGEEGLVHHRVGDRAKCEWREDMVEIWR